MDRREYVTRYGPSTGDRVRLADSNLFVRVEADHVGYGDEPLFGFGKPLRSRLLQHDAAARASELDLLVTGVLLLDPLLGVVKTNVGIKEGRVVGIGPVGDRAVIGQDLVVGPNTYPVPAFGLIATPGGVDSHVHLPTPRMVPAALAAGMTTLITAGFEEPPFQMQRMFEAFENVPINLGLQACARTADPSSAEAVIEAGAVGLKIHEDYGAYAELIDAALLAAQAHDVAVCLHTDGFNEAAEVDDTLAAIGGRTVHAYHVEGSAGGHLPDNLMLVTDPAVICSSTTPSIPYSRFTAIEHLAMTMAVHGGNPDNAHDVLAFRERVHVPTMAAEGPLHDFGAISIINSDSQGVGRMAETIRRTWQLADAMKSWRGSAGADWGVDGTLDTPHLSGPDDNSRVRKYLAKYTIEPAVVHGIADEVGSLMPGRLADIVLWRPAYFGVKPELVLKSGFETWGPLGLGNGSVERVQPTAYAAHWGGTGRAGSQLGVTFTSQLALDTKFGGASRTSRRVVAVQGTRGLSRNNMVLNRAVPAIEIDPVEATVTLAGRELAADAVRSVPLNRAYLIT